MSKNKRKNGKKNKANKHGRRYDPKMIQEFLTHLVCQLKIAIEDYGGKSPAEPGVEAHLMHFIKKYDAALLPIAVLDRAKATASSVEAFKNEVLPQVAAERQEQLEHLEALAPLFAEALTCARVRVSSGAALSRNYSAQSTVAAVNGAKPHFGGLNGDGHANGRNGMAG